jgi:hypothetical protein
MDARTKRKITQETGAIVSENDETAEPKYEWGIQYYSFRTGEIETKWGYPEDPRTNGVIDDDSEVEVKKYYHRVVAVGKRKKNPEIWEDLT